MIKQDLIINKDRNIIHDVNNNYLTILQIKFINFKFLNDYNYRYI